MTDESYTLSQTNRERKTIARSAAHRVNGSKSKRCTLPSDSLTQAQLKKLSGPVITYDMDKPHTWAELKLWPDDLRSEYITKLLLMRPSNQELSDVLQYQASHLFKILALCGIRRRRGTQPSQTPEQAAAWKAFTSSQDDAQEPEPETETQPAPTTAPISCVTSVTLDLQDRSLSDLVSLLLADPLLQHLTDTYNIHLTIERRPTT